MKPMIDDRPTALRGVFIGINRYQCSQISELSGAVADARALASIFEDSHANIQAQTLLDADAKHSTIDVLVTETLASANETDLVVISFSGHGTPNHHLLLNDSDPAQLDTTAISKTSLVDRVNASRAKGVLVVLDCCFSGDQPARVFADSWRSREFPAPEWKMYGTGRVLLSASRHDESAWESRRPNHGLLTHALVEVLTTLPERTSMSEIADKVMARVRIAARQMGKVQTPVLSLAVEGGLSLDPLIKGDRYHAHFRDYTRVRIGPAVGELTRLELPAKAVERWAADFEALQALQLTAVNEYGILRGESVFVVAPTSSGKTFIGELAAIRTAAMGCKSVFLVPYKALANEHHERFVRTYGESLGLRVLRCTSDDSSTGTAFVRGKYDIAVLTYEMFLNLALSHRAALARIGLVVVDEAHFIADRDRGAKLELLLALLRREQPSPQLVLLSAAVCETRGLEEWLGCRLLRHDHRPVPLTEGVIDRSGVYRYREFGGGENQVNLLEAATSIPSDQSARDDVLVPLVGRLVADGDTVLVFRNTRTLTSQFAIVLAEALGLPPDEHALAELPTLDPSTATQELRRCLTAGVVFHTSNLSPDERGIVERAFRDGTVRVMTATTGVAAGVNLPADTVIIVEHEFQGRQPRRYTVAEYENMAGRAGRLGLNRAGRSILVAANSLQRDHLFATYVEADAPSLESSFNVADLDDWIIRLLGQVERIPRSEITALLLDTFAGYSCQRINPEWAAWIRVRIEDHVAQFVSQDLVEIEDDCARLSLAGRACANASLGLRSALRFVQRIRDQAGIRFSAQRLAIALQMTAEMDEIYCPLASSPGVIQRTAARLDNEMAQFLRFGVTDPAAWACRCRRAQIVCDWAEGIPIETMEARYSERRGPPLRYGDIQRITNATHSHLRSAYDLLSVSAPDRAPDPDALEQFSIALEHGVAADLHGLLELPVSLTRGELLALGKLAVRDVATLLSLDEATLVATIGEAKARRVRCL